MATLKTSSTSNGDVIPNSEIVTYILYYALISAGIGSISGLLTGLLLKCFDKFDAEKTLTDKMFFTSAHGLRFTKEKEDLQKSASVVRSDGQDKSKIKELKKTKIKELSKIK